MGIDDLVHEAEGAVHGLASEIADADDSTPSTAS